MLMVLRRAVGLIAAIPSHQNDAYSKPSPADKTLPAGVGGHACAQVLLHTRLVFVGPPGSSWRGGGGGVRGG